jgi:HD-like signal output (HDOD) protein
MIDNIIELIDTLPPLPKSFHQINEICSNEKSTIEELAKVIESDPMLVANLLKVVNSPFYWSKKEIKNVLQAVTFFGMSATRSLTTDISIKKLMNVDIEPYGIIPEDFVKISGMQSALMREWYSKIDEGKVDIFFLPALLQETGKIIIADEIVRNDEVTQFKSEIQNSVNISQVEKMYVGTTTAEVTAKVFEHWDFDETLVDAIHYSDNYTQAPDEIREHSLALKIVKKAIPMNSPLSERSVTIALNLVRSEGLNETLFANAVEKIIEHN